MKSQEALRYAYNCGYHVNPNGDVISPAGNKLTKRIKRSGKSYKIYVFTIKYNGNIYSIPVHRLVSYQKFGELMFSCDCVRHLNNNSLDNSFDNIEIGTNKENHMDMPKEKRVYYASNAHKKYSKEKVDEIKAFYNKCRSYKKTREKYAIPTDSSLRHILLNR